MYTNRNILIAIAVLSSLNVIAQQNLTQYVNPFIGTGGHGHTYPGATMPHGMLQLSPDTRLSGWDGCGGYHYSDSFIYGFTHTHLSGTGVSDFGDILLMPMNGTPSADNKEYGSLFSHTEEKASPGYYAVKLLDNNIETEFTVTERTGLHHYIFSKTDSNNIILDLKHRDEVIESSINIEDSVTVTGLRRSKSWADNQYVFFVIKFSRPFIKNGIWVDDNLIDNPNNATSKNIKAYFNFDLSSTKDIFIKVAISAVSIEGAKKNLQAESKGWDFEKIKSLATEKWQSTLKQVGIKSEDKNKQTIFYTALYHTAIVPNINMDIDGQYRGRDNLIHKAIGFTNYSVFSLWDTYRAAHPLYTILDRKRTLDYIKTFLAQYEQGGRLPVWELAGCETNCMIGYHSVPVITDAYVKGIRDFDTKLALQAMEKSATWDHFGLPAYMKNGLIEVDDEAESVSKTLEYAYDDWCIARFAKATGNQNKYNEYIQRAQYYKNVLDLKGGFMRPRKNGDWLNPFDPREVNNNFTEANSWQYSFYFPQDIGGYTQLAGKQKLQDQLDNLFNASSQTTGREQSDISGLIGQYAHGNEPSHHIIYLYGYTNKKYRTQELVHKVMTEMYKNSPDGLIGNEDCGQMSAWYILSALGFYPVTPGNSEYIFGTPLFTEAVIHLENGNDFKIKAPAVNEHNMYVQKILLHTSCKTGTSISQPTVLHHDDIMYGGELNFIMDSIPSKDLKNIGIVPTIGAKSSDNIKIVINPVINGGGIAFKNSKMVTISSSQKDVKIFYSLDGKDPIVNSKKYEKPLLIDRSVTVKAIAVNNKGKKSFVSTAVYKKIPHDYTVTLNTNYEQQYNAGGSDGLIDGIYGTVDWNKGNWQGYQKNDMDLVIDLKKTMTVSKLVIGFLQDTRSWIVLPKEFTIETSIDGKDYSEIYKGKEFLPIENLEPQIMRLEPSFSAVTARYVRLKAIQFGKLPDWHESPGGDTHIFVDEIEIK